MGQNIKKNGCIVILLPQSCHPVELRGCPSSCVPTNECLCTPPLLLSPLTQAKRQQRKLNFLITQTELYAHFMGGKGPGGEDAGQEEILRKLEDTSAQRKIDIGGGVMVNVGQEDYGMSPRDQS